VKHFPTLLRHEIRILLIGPSTYIAGVLFLLVMGLVFWDLLTQFTRTAKEVPPASVFFQLFWFPVLFLVPLLTMRSMADERRLGTIETLMTTPVTAAEVVVSKFAAAYLFYLGLWSATGSFHWLLYRFAEDPRVIDPGPIVGGYLFIAASGAMFVATGIFSSSLTRSQLVAALAALVLIVVELAGGRLLAEVSVFQPAGNPEFRALAEHVAVLQHAEDFVGGVVDTRALVLCLSLAGLFLFASMLALDARSARS
jgi:ABC-2 type transport system permease protein